MPTLYSRNTKVEAAPMKDETILFNPGNNKFCELNVTAALIWQVLEQPKSVSEITAALIDKFHNTDCIQVEKDVLQVLDLLRNIECVVVVA